jgi:thiosulfate/3-mercaptopyruvate sulfurtransferase
MLTGFVCLGLALGAAGDYPKAHLLIEPAALIGAKAGSVAILDARGKHQYDEGHVPGAVWVDAVTWERAFNAQPDPQSWGRRLGEVGVDPGRPVVVYGSEDLRAAARVWWILRYWGVRDARLVNGGWPAWRAAGGPASREPVRPARRAVVVTPRGDRLATKGKLLAALKDNRAPQLVDARSEAEYCGLMKTAERNGAIPGSVHLEWTECLDRKSGRFKPAGELHRLLRERGIDVDRPAVCYCQSGGRSSVVAFTLELMGGNQVKNYYRSWAEWGNAADTPVEKKTPKNP